MYILRQSTKYCRLLFHGGNFIVSQIVNVMKVTFGSRADVIVTSPVRDQLAQPTRMIIIALLWPGKPYVVAPWLLQVRSTVVLLLGSPLSQSLVDGA